MYTDKYKTHIKTIHTLNKPWFFLIQGCIKKEMFTKNKLTKILCINNIYIII